MSSDDEERSSDGQDDAQGCSKTKSGNELALNQLSREQLASLSKEELIELLTNSKQKERTTQRRKSKSPMSKNVRKQAKINNTNYPIAEPLVKPKTTRSSSYANPSDSQSEQRNINVITNALPPEQEERETPISEPESDEDMYMRKLRKSKDDSGLTSSDTIESVNTANFPLVPVFEDICAVEKSVDSPRDDDHLHNSSTDDNQSALPEAETFKQVIAPGKGKVRTKSKSAKIRRKQPSSSSGKQNLKKSLPSKSRRSEKTKKKRRSASGLNTAASSTIEAKDSNITNSENIEKKQDTDKELKIKKNELDCVIAKEESPARDKKEIKRESAEKVSFVHNSEEEEEDETDDSYDIDNEVFFTKTPKKSFHSTKSVERLLDMVSDIKLEEEQPQKIIEDIEDNLDSYVTRKGADDPRRYLELGKTCNFSQKNLVGKQLESQTGLAIKENLKAQKLRRFISVGSGLDRRAVKDQLKQVDLEISALPAEQPKED